MKISRRMAWWITATGIVCSAEWTYNLLMSLGESYQILFSINLGLSLNLMLLGLYLTLKNYRNNKSEYSDSAKYSYRPSASSIPQGCTYSSTSATYNADTENKSYKYSQIPFMIIGHLLRRITRQKGLFNKNGKEPLIFPGAYASVYPCKRVSMGRLPRYVGAFQPFPERR